jgi:uncharacterized protein YbaA (DUF1428 family)
MARYVDGFVLPVPRKNLAVYRRMAAQAGKVWRRHGALEYVECVGDDLKIKGMYSFLKQAKAKPGETVFFSWIAYRSRAHRDQVLERVMSDPTMRSMMGKKPMPFDMKRMAYGGFKALVDA